MAGSNGRFTVAAITLPLLFLLMSGIGRAAGTVTNCTTFGPATGTLQAALAGGGTVTFACSGTIIVPQIDISSGTTTVNGAGQSVTLSGNHANQVFNVSGGATLNLQNLTIANGSSGGNGGSIENQGTLTVTNSTFSGNSAGNRGGGIDNQGTLTVTNCTFSGNNGAFAGGGIYTNGTLTVTNSTFSDNEADNGGGIENFDTLTVTNSTFAGNIAESFGDGGGIDNSGTLTVTNSTFSGNTASEFHGSGIFAGPGSATLKGTILANESDGGNCSGEVTPPVTASYSIADDDTCFTNGTNNNIVESSTSAVGLDPAGLAMNGGPTQTIALEPNSPALDFIPVASCKDQSTPTPLLLTTDQRGFPRPDSGNLNFCDAGAFELQTGRITVKPGTERTQIARLTSGTSDLVNMAFTFTDSGSPILDDPPSIVGPHCDDGTDALNGIDVDLFEGTCNDLATATGGLLLDLSPFVVHTVNHESYGTLFQSSLTSPETVSARIVQLPTPGGTCGEWTLNIEVAGLDTAAIGLGGGNPFALVIEDGDKNEGCFDVSNAIVGNQIPTPGHKVRRGVRR